MTPALTGAQSVETKEFIYLAGGQDGSDKATNGILKVKRCNPAAIEKAGTLKVPRVDPFFFKVGDKMVVMGGCDKPVMEVFNEKLEPVAGCEAKSDAFFGQLACYTTDLKLENCSYG